MRYAATRGDGLQNTINAIRSRQDFDAGNLWGETVEPGHRVRSKGWLPEVWVTDLDETERDLIDYVVFSYYTPMAWHTPDGWVFPDVRYSASTGKHQTTIRRAIGGNAVVTLNARTHTLASVRRAAEVFA